MWGGGMLFNEIVVQEDARHLWMNLECELFLIRNLVIIQLLRLKA